MPLFSLAKGRHLVHCGRVWLASELTSRGASTTDVMRAGNWEDLTDGGALTPPGRRRNAITLAQRAEIRRLFYGEHWKVGTIAAQLGLHRETVRAAVERETAGVRPSLCRPSILDPYLPFIRDTLAQYPRLRATRIHEMVRQRGYAGSVFPVRRLVRRLRPESGRAVYRRVVTLVGEQAQVDWGSFGKVHIGHGTRTVSGFVMVLGYSRALAALFTLDQTHADGTDAPDTTGGFDTDLLAPERIQASFIYLRRDAARLMGMEAEPTGREQARARVSICDVGAARLPGGWPATVDVRVVGPSPACRLSTGAPFAILR